MFAGCRDRSRIRPRVRGHQPSIVRNRWDVVECCGWRDPSERTIPDGAKLSHVTPALHDGSNAAAWRGARRSERFAAHSPWKGSSEFVLGLRHAAKLDQTASDDAFTHSRIRDHTQIGSELRLQVVDFAPEIGKVAQTWANSSQNWPTLLRIGRNRPRTDQHRPDHPMPGRFFDRGAQVEFPAPAQTLTS